MLSDLLWAAFGINRPSTGDRTAPYWRHVMVIDVYAAMADGVWLYEPKRHSLISHLRIDITGGERLERSGFICLPSASRGHAVERAGDPRRLAPDVLEPTRRELSVAHSRLNAAMAQIGL